MNKKLLKLAKALLQLAEVATDKAVLIYEGALAEGTEVFVEDENGDLTPAPDETYITDEYEYVVAEGKVVEIREVAKPEPEPEPEPKPVAAESEEEIAALKAAIEEKDARIAELEASVAEKDAYIAELEAKIAEKESEAVELRSQLEKPEAKPAKEAIRFNSQKVTDNKIRFNQFEK